MMGNSEQILLQKLSTDEIYVLMSFLYSQSLVAFLSAVKVQSRKVSLSFAGQSTGKTVCHGVDNYLQAVCSANKSSQCEARADGDSKSESKVKTI